MFGSVFWMGPLGPSLLSFPETFLQYLRLKGCLVLWYLLDFLLSPGKDRSSQSCLLNSIWIQDVMDHLDLKRYATKGMWDGGATKLDHLGSAVDTELLIFSVTEKKKQKRMRCMAKKLLYQARMEKGLVSSQLLSSLRGKVSLTLAVPLARFFARSLYTAMSSATWAQNGVKVRLGKVEKNSSPLLAEIRWRREIYSQTGANDLHTLRCRRLEMGRHRAASVTLSEQTEAGINGKDTQGIWTPQECVKTVAWQELGALRLVIENLPELERVDKMLLEAGIKVTKYANRRRSRIKCWIDNAVVVYIVRYMVTASTEMMTELRLRKNPWTIEGSR